jgi:hypothetical protein
MMTVVLVLLAVVLLPFAMAAGLLVLAVFAATVASAMAALAIPNGDEGVRSAGRAFRYLLFMLILPGAVAYVLGLLTGPLLAPGR